MLNSRYFERSFTRSDKGSTWEAYKAVHARSTMVLFSKQTRTPLAALTLTTQDTGCLHMLTGRPSPKDAKEPYFQGMLNMPDQVFAFTITNLSPVAMINFNILHTPHRVTHVDPGPAFGVNEVNELHPNQTYTVQADQRTNRTLILKGQTKRIRDANTGEEKEIAVSVQDTESDDKPSKGLYFYLSVVPDKACPELVQHFAEGTVWKAVPSFVRKGQTPSVYEPEDEHVQRQQSTSATRPCSLMAARRQRQQQARSSQEQEPPRRPTVSASAALSTPSMQRGLDMRVSCRSSAPANPSSMFRSVDVGTTQAGQLAHGHRVTVQSHATGREYAFDQASDPTVLCLSIWHDMKFFPLPDLDEELRLELEDRVQHQGRHWIDALTAVYHSDTCVIDLESPADTIVCNCGHQCLHHSNVTQTLRRCPVCRAAITALVRADGVLVE